MYTRFFLYWIKYLNVEDKINEQWFVISRYESNAHDFHGDYMGLDFMVNSLTYENILKKESYEKDIEYNPSSDIDDYEDCIIVEEVLKLPPNFLKKNDQIFQDKLLSRYAQIEDLKKLEFKIIDDGEITSQKIVKYKNKIYKEGSKVIKIK